MQEAQFTDLSGFSGKEHWSRARVVPGMSCAWESEKKNVLRVWKTKYQREDSY